jgi:hypothetical protein
MILNFNKILSSFFVLLFIALINANVNAQTRIAVLYSNYTDKNPDINSHKVIDEITLWEIFLMQEKISYKVIYDSDLESGIQDDFDILILADVNAISEDEMTSIKEFLQEGNSVLSVGSRLSLDEKGNFFGGEFTSELFGIQAEEYWEKKNIIAQSLSLNPFFDENLISTKLLLSTKYKPLICEKLNSGTLSLGYIENQDRNYPQTSLIYGKVGKGKIVWTGFNIDDVAGSNEQVKTFKQLILNSLKWLDKLPDIWIDNFPDGMNSAEIIAIKNNFSLNPELIDKLIQEKMKPYLITSSQQKIPEVLKSILDKDSFILDLSNLDCTKNDTALIFIKEIISARSQFKINFDKIIIPESIINNLTLLDKISELGINYFLYPSDISLLPALVADRFFIIPYRVYSKNGLLNGVNFITNNFAAVCDSNSDEDLLTTISEIDTRNNWITDLKTLKNWWINKSKIDVSINKINKDQAVISITNNGNEIINKISLILNWPFIFAPSNFSVKENTNIIDYKFLNTGEINIYNERLEAHQTKRLNLNFGQY